MCAETNKYSVACTRQRRGVLYYKMLWNFPEKKAKPIGFVIKPWRDYCENAFSSIAGTDVMSQQISELQGVMKGTQQV